jgi:hypothetical protein
VNNAPTVALYKEFKLNEPWRFRWVGWDLLLSAQPSSARRNEFDFWLDGAGGSSVRWNCKPTTSFRFSLPAELAAGCDQQCRGRIESLSHALGRLTAIRVSSKQLTQSVFDYTVVNVGGTLALEFRF